MRLPQGCNFLLGLKMNMFQKELRENESHHLEQVEPVSDSA